MDTRKGNNALQGWAIRQVQGQRYKAQRTGETPAHLELGQEGQLSRYTGQDRGRKKGLGGGGGGSKPK